MTDNSLVNLDLFIFEAFSQLYFLFINFVEFKYLNYYIYSWFWKIKIKREENEDKDESSMDKKIKEMEWYSHGMFTN